MLAALVALTYLGPRTSRARVEPLPLRRAIGAFSVTNQVGDRVTRESLRGRAWVIDLIFTRCPGPCRQLSGVMRRVQERLPSASRAGLMSITSDPEFDTPGVLSKYAAQFGAEPGRWQFVTGSKPDVRRLATDELLLVVKEKTEEERENADDLFLHSTMIVVLDREGNLRTAIEGLEVGAEDRILAAVAAVERGE